MVYFFIQHSRFIRKSNIKLQWLFRFLRCSLFYIQIEHIYLLHIYIFLTRIKLHNARHFRLPLSYRLTTSSVSGISSLSWSHSGELSDRFENVWKGIFKKHIISTHLLFVFFLRSIFGNSGLFFYMSKTSIWITCLNADICIIWLYHKISVTLKVCPMVCLYYTDS